MSNLVEIEDAKWKAFISAQQPTFRKGMIAGLQEAACICGQTTFTLAIMDRIDALQKEFPRPTP